MKNFKNVVLFLLLIFSIGSYGQTTVHKNVKISAVNASQTTDSVLTIDGSGVLRKSNINIENIDFSKTKSKSLVGNILTFENIFGNYYNIYEPNAGNILLDTIQGVFNGVSVIYSKGAAEPAIQGTNLYKIGNYVSDNNTINRLKFRFLTNNLTELKIDSIFQVNETGAEEIDIDAFNFTAFYRASDANVSGSTVTDVPDLSGNAYHLSVFGDPQLEINGINGRPSIRFDGDDGLSYLGTYTQRIDQSELAGWVVFKVEEPVGVVYHSIIFVGANSMSTTGPNTMHLYNLNTSDQFIQAFDSSVPALQAVYDTTNGQTEAHSLLFNKNQSGHISEFDNGTPVTKVGVQDVSNTNLFVGLWNGRGLKGLVSEIALRQDPFSVTELVTLRAYLSARYGISSGGTSTPVTVINEAVSGNTTQLVLDRMSTINSHNSDLAVIQIGVNDWRVPVTALRKTPAEYKTNLTAIVDALQAAGTTNIIIQTIPPILNEESDYVCSYFSLPSGCDANATGNPYRLAQQEVANEQGSTVYLHSLEQNMLATGQVVFSASSFIQNQFNADFNPDGVHLTVEGSTFVALDLYNFTFLNSIPFTNVVFIGDSNSYNDGLSGGGTATGNSVPGRFNALVNN